MAGAGDVHAQSDVHTSTHLYSGGKCHANADEHTDGYIDLSPHGDAGTESIADAVSDEYALPDEHAVSSAWHIDSHGYRHTITYTIAHAYRHTITYTVTHAYRHTIIYTVTHASARRNEAPCTLRG